jgi:hypothetical protein
VGCQLKSSTVEIEDGLPLLHQPPSLPHQKKEFFGKLSFRGNLRHAKLGKVWDSKKKILHLILTMLWFRNHPHLARNHLCFPPVIDYWMGISCSLLSRGYYKF